MMRIPPKNCRCSAPKRLFKLDRLGVVFGESGQTDGRRAADRFTYDEMNNMRRCRYRQFRAQRFNGPRAHRACAS